MDITTIAIILLFCFVFVIAFILVFFVIEPLIRMIANKIKVMVKDEKRRIHKLPKE